MASSSSEDKPWRPTGNMERFNIIRNSLNFYNNIAVTTTYSVPSQFTSSYQLQSIIYSTLAEVLKTQSLLGVTIQDEMTKEPKYKRLEIIDMLEVVMFTKDELNEGRPNDDWITQGHRTRLDRVDELPLWRLRVSASASTVSRGTYLFTISFLPHHAICDGLSASAFHINFLSSLNHLIANPDLISPSNFITVPKIPLPETLEQRCALPISTWFAAKQIFKAFVYNPTSPLLWTGPRVQSTPPEKPPKSNLISISVSDSQVQKLLGKCREQKCTFTCLLAVLVARRLGEMYPGRRFTCQIPFSLRKWTGHGKEEMGCLVSGLSPVFSAEVQTPNGCISCFTSPTDEENDKNLWISARQCRKIVQDGTRSEKDQAVGMLAWVSDIRSFFLGRLGTKRDHTFEITNIGVLEPSKSSDGGEAKFVEAIFSTACCTYADPYIISVATVNNGPMAIGLNWISEVTADEDAKGMIEWLQKSLGNIAGDWVPGQDVYVEKENEKRVENSYLGRWAVGFGLGVVAAIGATWLMV